MIKIDGTTYNVPIKEIVRKADFLDKYAERSEDGKLHREIIGVYFNYQMTFGRDASTTEYVSLWQKLTEPVEFHSVVVPDEDGYHTFTAYFSNVGDKLVKAKDADGTTTAQRFWKDLTVNFIAQEPART